MPRTIGPVVTSFGVGEQPALAVDGDVVLRPFGPDDAAVVRSAFTFPEIIRWHHFRIDSDADAAAWIERTHRTWESGSKVDWLIEEHGVGVGRVGLGVDPERGTAEIAYWLLRSGRGRGLATRSAVAATRWAHGVGFHHIALRHSVENPASCAVAIRLGYLDEGTARQAHIHEDGWHDMHQHGHVTGDPLG